MGKVTLITGRHPGREGNGSLACGQGIRCLRGGAENGGWRGVGRRGEGPGILLKAVQVDVTDDSSVRAAVSRVGKESGRLTTSSTTRVRVPGDGGGVDGRGDPAPVRRQRLRRGPDVPAVLP